MYFLHFIYRKFEINSAGSKGCRFRPGLHGSGQIFKQTSSLLARNCATRLHETVQILLQHCLHESTQICRPLKNLHGGSTSPMWTKDGSVQVFVSSCKGDLSLIIFCHVLVWTIAYT